MDHGAWGLDPTLTFLNHGSYGCCLREVLDAQTDIRARMERDPARFFKVDLERLMDGVRERLGVFLNCPPEDLAPLANATLALATILHNTDFREGDEVLVTDHEYSSGTNELERLAPRRGIRVVRARVPFPISALDKVAEAVLGAVTPRTRLVLLSHLTSATSLIFPVEKIVPELNRRGIDVIVDGAHTPGQIPVDIRALDPTYYVCSLHKWVSAPKGTAFMYVHPDRQRDFRTVVLSSRADKVRPDRALYLRDFDYMGTADYSGILAIPAALDAMGALVPGGWPELMRRNHALALRARDIVCRAIGVAPPAPDSMIGSMASIILPPADPALASRPTIYDDPLQDALVDRHRVQVPVWPFGGRHGTPALRLLRVSAQVYNWPEQYRKLGEALAQELAAERGYRKTA